MSFGKAEDLLKLAEMAAARHIGVSLADISEEFGCTYRTAQRMTRALEQTFTGVVTRTDDEQRKYWVLGQRDIRLLAAQGLRDSELVALEMSIRRAERDGATNEMAAIRRVRDRQLAAMPKPHARRTESDAEAILEALGFACRPGPKVVANERLLSTIAAALRGPFLISMTYGQDATSAETERLVEPYGLLLGTRKYLVGKIQGENDRLRHFRLDRIHAIKIQAQSFNRDPDFSLETHAARAFGSFQSDNEYSEVIWRFSPAAARNAREFLFHPAQEMAEEADGSLTVRFTASGHLEMAWHLYMWGDGVEVVAPDTLREMVEKHRRLDFPALP
jgi:predicted DNA-binding transcriptional regulator YafY